jgi:hypothetical protein
MRRKSLSSNKMSERSHDPKMAFYKRAVSEGIPYKKPGDYTKFSGSVHAETFEEFRSLTSRLGYKLQDALTEAMDLWIAERSKKS